MYASPECFADDRSFWKIPSTGLSSDLETMVACARRRNACSKSASAGMLPFRSQNSWRRNEGSMFCTNSVPTVSVNPVVGCPFRRRNEGTVCCTRALLLLGGRVHQQRQRPELK